MNPTDPIASPVASATATDLKPLARVGGLASEPLGQSDTHATPRGGQSPHRTLPSNTMLGEFVGTLLDLVARVLSPAFVERSLARARNIGHYAVLAAGALTLLYAIFAAIKYNSFGVFVTGVCLIAALAVAQFAATRFLAAAVQTIAHTPSRISSPAFLECTGLLVLLIAAAVLIVGIVSSIQLGSFVPLLPAVLLSAALGYFGAIALHPTLVNVGIGDGSAGEEAIGLLTFFSKAGLALVPLFFCLLAVGGCLALIASFFQAGQTFAASISSVLQLLPLPVGLPPGLAGSAVVLLACLLPLFCYFVFLLQYLALDVLRAILAVPGKLDALRKTS